MSGLCLGTNLLRVNSMELNQTYRKHSLHIHISFEKAILKNGRRIKSTKPTKHQKSDRSMNCIGRQTTTASVCSTGGKPSTRLPPGRLVEQACAFKRDYLMFMCDFVRKFWFVNVSSMLENQPAPRRVYRIEPNSRETFFVQFSIIIKSDS